MNDTNDQHRIEQAPQFKRSEAYSKTTRFSGSAPSVAKVYDQPSKLTSRSGRTPFRAGAATRRPWSSAVSFDDPLILFRLHIVGLRVALVDMIGFDHMTPVHMIPVRMA
jgi:hypothetical protein